MATNTKKKILVIQPPGSARESLLILLYGTGHAPQIADTIDDGLHLLQSASQSGSRYDVIFLSDFPIEDMRKITTLVGEDTLQQATDIIACSENISMWAGVTAPYFSFTKRVATGWNIHNMLCSFFPIKHLA